MKYTKEKSKKHKVLSIKTKLVATILPVVCIIIVGLVLFSYNISRQSMEKAAQDELEMSASKQETEIEAWLNENLASFQSAKAAIEQLRPDEAVLSTILNAYMSYDADFPNGMYVADEAGNYWKASESTKQAEKNPTQSEWYQQGLSRVNMAFTTAYRNENDKYVISASGILNDGSGIPKVISGDMTLDKISIIVNSAIDMENAQAFLVDTTDSVILAHRDDTVLSTKLSTDNQDAFLSGVAQKLQDKEYAYCEIDGKMTTLKKIKGTNWMLVSYIPKDIVLSQVEKLKGQMFFIGIISVLLLGGLIEFVTHVMIKPVKKMTAIITAMTNGDFTVKVNIRGRDEIAHMGRSVSKFIESMKHMIQDIDSISGQLLTQAGDSDTISQNMYDAAQTQSKSMQELNLTVDQMSISVNEIAQSATQLAMVVDDAQSDSVMVDTKMRETVSVSKEGRQDMERVSQAMNMIQNSVSSLGAAINEVGTASDEITKIVGMIGEIAEETNLLALNASIEAARAGEMGRGFAVVASQIGKLAQTSADSVDHITKLINEINVLVGNAVSQAADSTDNIRESSTLIDTAVNTFSTIYADIMETNDLIAGMIEKVKEVDSVASNVAAISEEQAASSDEILATSENMVTQANAITHNSEQVADESKNLTETSKDLSEQIRIFRI